LIRRVEGTTRIEIQEEYRPNPIAMTVCKIMEVDEINGILQVANIDA
jgi:tRNA (Thr-GGU) A37 N-methylase